MCCFYLPSAVISLSVLLRLCSNKSCLITTNSILTKNRCIESSMSCTRTIYRNPNCLRIKRIHEILKLLLIFNKFGHFVSHPTITVNYNLKNKKFPMCVRSKSFAVLPVIETLIPLVEHLHETLLENYYY